MKAYQVTIEGKTHNVDAKSELDAVVTILNTLGLRYEFSDFKVQEYVNQYSDDEY